MEFAKVGRLLAAFSAALLGVALMSIPAQAASVPKTVPGRFIVLVRNASDYAALRDGATRAGASVVLELPQANAFVITSSTAVSDTLRANPRVLGVALDHVENITTEDRPAPNLSAPGLRSARQVTLPASRSAAPQAGIVPDPAFSYQGLQWDYTRMGLPAGWRTTAGDSAVNVGVADTGLDFTNTDLGPNVRQVVDLTKTENPPLCKTYFGQSDADLAAQFGGPENTDWNGHGSWIGGNIAAVVNGSGINGIAPRVNLVALKISQWCGSAYDSTILSAFLTAAAAHLDVVSISFGGYLDRSDPSQNLIYQLYVRVVAAARQQGTTIVASAGNEHVRVGAGGQVLSHGQLTTPGSPVEDLFGLYETPGGIPGVVDVSATGNVVNAPSINCPAGSTGTADDTDAVCKPTTDRHKSPGVGQQNQLAYYSDYGPRIDIAAPGGARKFNLPVWDRGGTPGFPYTTADLTNVWEDFSTTSNWGVEIPCFTFSPAGGFPQGQCYSTIQGTSMATPHVSAAVALAASAHANLRHDPAGLIAWVKSHAVSATNTTQPVSATDTSKADLTGAACPTGYCHLGGAGIPSAEAYGAGLLNVSTP